jgi:hypothetical protein
LPRFSGEVDQVFRDVTREEAIAAAERISAERATAAGTDPATLRVIETEDIPIAYLPGNARRVRVRSIGDVASVSQTDR